LTRNSDFRYDCYMTPKAYCRKYGLTGTKFGERIGLSKHTACRLVKGNQKTSPKRALMIERKTKGEITVHDLRPDIFGRRPKLPTTPVAETATGCQGAA
jgi:hypothetical protein